jgi:hypothetical protein
MRFPYRLLILIVLLASSSGCATLQLRDPEAESRLIAANEALAILQDRIEQFYVDLETVRVDLRTFYQEPGWQDMRQIILTVLSTESSEVDDPQLQDLVESSTAEWAAAWQSPWEERFGEYLDLVRRCTALEARRIGLQAELFGVQGKFLGVSVSEYSRGRYNQGRASDEVVELLSRSAEELGSYSIDEVGLYEVQ